MLGWRYQRALLEHACALHKLGNSVHDSLLLVEHPRVFTLGRGASLENVKFTPSTSPLMPKLVRVERGGEVTWHGPGQLVAYPILNLHHHKKDLHWYTTSLEETVIRALAHFGVSAGRNEANTGVWVGPNKISAIGVTASRWHTMHGVSVNVNNSLDDYASIVPCGIARDQTGLSVCRLSDRMSPASSPKNELLEAFQSRFLNSFAEVFNLELEPQVAPQAYLDKLATDLEMTSPEAAAVSSVLGIVAGTENKQANNN
jgi:lipoyl(octanoyl) transferase